jgi:hypothetical protein
MGTTLATLVDRRECILVEKRLWGVCMEESITLEQLTRDNAPPPFSLGLKARCSLISLRSRKQWYSTSSNSATAVSHYPASVQATTLS